MIAKTQQGLEPLLEKELQELGAKNTQRQGAFAGFVGSVGLTSLGGTAVSFAPRLSLAKAG